MKDGHPCILITGFGPFPGVEVNISLALAAEAARALEAPRNTAEAHAVLLPTDWIEGPAVLRRALDELSPQCLLLFGVSRKARCVVVETLARNEMRAADASGRLPTADVIAPDGSRYQHSRWPARRLVRMIREAGIPAIRSRNAGSYLCNRVLYEALAGAKSQPTLQTCGFVHFPAHLADKGGDPDQRIKSGKRLSWDDAVRAAQLVASSMSLGYSTATTDSAG